jgi:hypothetical protein
MALQTLLGARVGGMKGEKRRDETGGRDAVRLVMLQPQRFSSPHQLLHQYVVSRRLSKRTVPRVIYSTISYVLHITAARIAAFLAAFARPLSIHCVSKGCVS